MTKALPQPPLILLILNPAYLPTWLGLSGMWLLAHLSFNLQMRIGTVIRHCSFHLARERRRICEIKLALRFPELSTAEQATLVRNTFVSTGIDVIETGMAWYRNPRSFKDRVTVDGLEHLQYGQDYDAKHRVYAKFFGATAVTITATSKFAAFNN